MSLQVAIASKYYFLRFDNKNARIERPKIGKAAPIRDVWKMQNTKLQEMYKPLSALQQMNSFFRTDEF